MQSRILEKLETRYLGASPGHRKIKNFSLGPAGGLVIRNTALLTIAFLTTTAVLAQVLSSTDAAKKLKALFDEDWEWELQQYPEAATLLGDNRLNDRLTDYSPDAIEKRKAHERDILARVQRIDRSRLSGQDAISYDLFLRDKKLIVDGDRFPTEYMPIDQMNGVQITFGQLAASTPFRNKKDYNDYLKRLAALSTQVDQLIALMKRGIETKWVPPAVPLRSVPGQIEGQITDDPTKSPFFNPFDRFPEAIPGNDRSPLVESAKKVISETHRRRETSVLSIKRYDPLNRRYRQRLLHWHTRRDDLLLFG